MESLIHVIYASTAVAESSEAELAEILRIARRNNERAGVTGMLVASERSFFQVLEGPRVVVDAVFATILADPRHSRVVTIIRERVATRAFGEWSMGFASPSGMESLTTPGLNDFFSGASCLDDIDAGRARKLLAAFRSGRWRARLSGGAFAGAAPG
ncbi:MAG: BLUF domain-containing protein [bacterium]